MRVLIIYESLFGNTRAVAEAVGAGIRALRRDAVVDCRRVDEAGALAADLDLLILGAPTHFWGLTRPVSRAMESQYERRFMPAAPTPVRMRQATPTSGMRGWVASLPPGGGRAAAAFDTCMSGPLTGGARREIASRLDRAGYRLLTEPETFLVEGVAGPLRAGEADRARAWGRTLSRALDQHDTPNRRQTMQGQNGQLLTTPDPTRSEPTTAANGTDVRPRPPFDLTRIVTTTEVVVGAVLVARVLSRRPGATKAVVTMGPGGWVSMKGGTVAVRRGSRPWARPTPVTPRRDERAPLWARVLSAVPLQALMR